MSSRTSAVLDAEQRFRKKTPGTESHRSEVKCGSARGDSAPYPAGSGPWLNADQAADYLALRSRKALYEIVRLGRVPYYRFGHSFRFRREELDEVIEAGCMRPAAYERRKKEIASEDTPCVEPDRGYDPDDARLQQKGGR